MEIKDNVRQRRLDRMKQLTETAQVQYPYSSRNLDMPPLPGHQLQAPTSPMEGPPSFPQQGPEIVDERWHDPEFVWKQRDRIRAEGGPGMRGFAPPPVRYPDTVRVNGSSWLPPQANRQLWVKVGLAAVIFAAAFGTFQVDHPLALKGRQWVTAALTKDYNFASAAAWYEAKFSGLPAVLPASWRRFDPETQKTTAVTARQMVSPVAGRVITPYTMTDTMIGIETSSMDVKAMDAGRILSVVTGADNRVQVVIQHADGLQSTYGGLASTTLKRFDWIKGGDAVGRLDAAAGSRVGRLLFAVKRDNQWIDPLDVVPFD